MALVRTILALLLAGSMIVAVTSLICFSAMAQWWSLLAFATLALWAWFANASRPGEDRNDFGV